MESSSPTDVASLIDIAAASASCGEVERLRQCFTNGLTATQAVPNVLWAAERSGKSEVLQVLFDNGIRINHCFEHMGTPLSRCVWHRRKTMVRYLLGKGADPNTRLTDLTPMPVATAVRMTKPDDTELLEMLLDAGATIPNTAALHIASLMGQLLKMRILLARGADVNEILAARVRTHLQFFLFATPLHWAVHGGQKDAVKLLLAGTPNLELQDEHGVSVKDALERLDIKLS